MHQQVHQQKTLLALLRYFEITDKKKWTPLVWAACKGNIEIVRMLINKGAAQTYINNQCFELLPEYINKKVVLGQINNQNKPTPLQWAAFKNHLFIFWILLKIGLSQNDCDSFGNNSVNLAAAGNAIEIFKCLLQKGAKLDQKNSRGHVVKDLATDKEILRLNYKYQETKECNGCQKDFKEHEIKHWCWTCDGFFMKDCFQTKWVQVDINYEDKEKLEGRCKICWNKIEQTQAQLENAIEQYEFEILSQQLDSIKNNNLFIDIKLKAKAEFLKQKLFTQNQILKYIDTLKVVQNYKILLKSAAKIQQMLDEAAERKLNIDQNVIQIAKKQIARLNSQRNLRFLIDNLDAAKATVPQVQNLQEIYKIAEENNVAENYMIVANDLKSKLRRGIKAQDLKKLFSQFPAREKYIGPLSFDPKSKRLLDPENKKKPIDPAILLPKKLTKKQKLKQPQWPQWANDLKLLDQNIKLLDQLIKSGQQLNLNEEFQKEALVQITKMKKQLMHRKSIQTLQRLVDEAKKAAAKKKNR